MLWHGVSENKKAGNFARSVLLHPVQRCYKFPIPLHPSSSNLIPFISQTPYIYLTGFQLGFVLADYFYKLFMNKGYLKIHDGGFR